MKVSPLVIAVFLLTPPLAWAQSAATGAALPGQIERQFQEAPKARSQSTPLSAPIKPQVVPERASEVRIQVKRVAIDGATVYAQTELDAEFASLQGSEITLADLYAAADKLTRKYRNDGYLLSQVIVPEQQVSAGVAKLQVVEGFIDKVFIEGVENDRRGVVAAYAEVIRNSRPLSAAVLERQMLLINDLPGAFARAILSPSAATFGAADLTIRFTQKVISGGLSLGDRGGRSIGPRRYMMDVEFDNLLGMQERTQVRYVASPNDELEYSSFLHEQVVGSAGGKLGIAMNRVRARPEELSFIPLNIETKSTGVSLTYSHPVLRTRSQNLQLRASLAAHDGETSIFGVTDTEDHLRIMRFGVGYDLADRWDGINIFDIEYSHGLRGMGASRNGDPFLSRPFGRVDFHKLSYYAARMQNITPSLSLLAAFSGQYAFDNLLSSELFSFGGESVGRGYDPSELVGDHGAALKIELRYASIANLGIPVPYTIYGFYDAGQVRQRPVAGVASAESASASGLGIRFGIGPYFSGYVEFAKPLTRDVAVEGNRKSRLYSGVSVRF